MELEKLENKIKNIFKDKNNLLKKSTPTTPLNTREKKIYDNFINNNNNNLVYLTESGIGHTLYYLYRNNNDIYLIEIEGLAYDSDFKISGIDRVWY